MPLRGDPGIDTGHAGEIMSLNWLRNPSVSPWRAGGSGWGVWGSLLTLLPCDCDMKHELMVVYNSKRDY